LTEVSLEDDHRSDPEENPAQVVAVSMDRQRVQTALLKLSPEQRQVVELRFVEGWSHEDVADAIGKSIEATRALQHRAVSALRALLTESE
jgi:RNA polymerase sigma-70 factor (ECF subfamily)